MSSPTPLAIGFVPLTDCAVLVAAHELGFAAARGLSLTLVRDVSWATARDRLVYGQVQAAHMLGPLAIAVSLGLGGVRADLAAPFRLNLNGSQIVVSRAIAAGMGMPAAARVADPAAAAQALARAIAGRVPASGPAIGPTIGIVHRFSSHALLLRYWLGAAGIDPDRDVVLRVLPPSMVVEALASGEIDGFCAGEPFGSIAVEAGVGETAAIGARLWRGGVEKVLAMRRDWMDAHPDTVDALLAALDEAARWCEDATNHAALAAMLGRPAYLNQPAALILPALQGRLRIAAGAGLEPEPDMLVFHRGGAGFPTAGPAAWIYRQFARWGLVAASPAAAATASRVFRPDIYRRALGSEASAITDAALFDSAGSPS